jgi:HAD superfamily hydrolase (TIGR01490 family)
VALAIFDLDETLLAGDSDHAWGEFLIEKGLVEAAAHRSANDAFYKAYKEGGLDILAYLKFVLAPTKGMEAARLLELQSEFLSSKVEPMITQGGLKALAQHRERGDTLMIITATNDLVTAPIARHLGVRELLASQAQFRDGRPTGEIEGIPCFKEGKVARLRQWLMEHMESLKGSTFYSDSHNDIPLLETVETAVAVDPDPKLAAFAKEQEWRIMSFRP